MNPTSLSLTIMSLNTLFAVIWLIRLSNRVDRLEKENKRLETYCILLENYLKQQTPTTEPVEKKNNASIWVP